MEGSFLPFFCNKEHECGTVPFDCAEIETAISQKNESCSSMSVMDIIRSYLKDKTLMSQLTKHVMSHLAIETCSKDEAEATESRLEGNRHFQQKNWMKALKCYNDSVSLAPGTPEGVCLPLAYGNRSAVMFELKNWKLCMRDIERAIENGYTEESKSKLFRRREKCLFELVKDTLSLNETEEKSAYEGRKSNPGSQGDDPYDFEAVIERGQKNITSRVSSVLENEHLAYGKHPKIDGLSNGLELTYNAKRKKHEVVARQPFKTGDIVVMERPYTVGFRPNCNEYDTLCFNCTIPLRECCVVPCPQCSGVRYCSEDCQEESWSAHHYVMCGFVVSMFKHKLLRASLQIVLKADINKLWKLRPVDLKRVKSPDGFPGFDEENFYRNDSYYAIYHLTDWSYDLRDITDVSVKQDAALTGVSLLLFIENVGSTRRKDISGVRKKPNKGLLHKEDAFPVFTGIEDRLRLAILFSRSYLQAEKKTYKMGNERIPEEYLRHDNVRYAFTKLTYTIAEANACGLYVSYVLLGHSCIPNTVFSCVNDTIVCRAITDVKLGEEVTVTYCTNAHFQPYEVRKKRLSEFDIDSCDCCACKDDLDRKVNAKQILRRRPDSRADDLARYQISSLSILDMYEYALLLFLQEEGLCALDTYVKCLSSLCNEKSSSSVPNNRSRMFVQLQRRILGRLYSVSEAMSHLPEITTDYVFYRKEYLTKIADTIKVCTEVMSNDEPNFFTFSQNMMIVNYAEIYLEAMEFDPSLFLENKEYRSLGESLLVMLSGVVEMMNLQCGSYSTRVEYVKKIMRMLGKKLGVEEK